MNTIQNIQKLSELLNHRHIRLTNRGNSAIKHTLKIVKKVSDKKFILIPDQGGWLTYKDFAEKEGFTVKYLKTDNGYITPDMINPKSCAAVLVTQPAGYFAALNLKKIYEVCQGDCILIADVSGSIGNKKQCDGKYADIMLGSFSQWKPVNVGYGGFISFKNKNLLDISQSLSLPEFKLEYEKELLDKLNTINERYDFLYSVVDEVKKDLKEIGLDLIHPDKKGLVVLVKFNNDEEKQNILSYCKINNYEWTECPRYIRVNENAISIEIKRLINEC